jgi:hypothetical protein
MTTVEETKSSALTSGQIDWLAATLLKGTVAPDGKMVPPIDMKEMQASGELVTIKLKMLDDARKTIESKAGEIAVGQDFSINLQKGSLEGFLRGAFKKQATIRSISKDSDNPDDELDTEHDKTQGISPEAYQNLMRAQSIISAEVTKLQEAKTKDGMPIPFSKKEIADAIWAPLMRRKVIPENAIPDDYSEVSRTFEGASDEYESRLLAYSEKLSKWDDVASGLGLGKDIVEGIGKVAMSATKMLKLVHVPVDGSQHAEAVHKLLQGDQIKSIVELTTIVLSGALDVGKQVASAHGKIDSKSLEGIAKSVAKTASASVIAAFGIAGSGDNKSLATIGQTVADAITMGMAGLSFSVKVIKGDSNAALVECGSFVQAALTVVGDQVDCPQAQLDMLGEAIADGFKTAAEAKKFAEAVEAELAKSKNGGKPDYTKIQAALLSTVESAVQGATSMFLDVYKDNLSSLQEKKLGEKFTESNGSVPDALGLGDKLAQIQAMTPEELKEAFKDDKQMLALADMMKKAQAEAVKQANEEMEEKLEEEAKSFRALLAGAETGDEESELVTIEAVILKIKQDQMIVDLVHSLIKLPAQAAAMFLPQASVAVSAIDLVFKIGAAIQHYVALAEWRDNLDNARSAMSVQVEAMANRVGLASLQAVDATIEALNQGAQLMAQITAATGDIVAVSGGHFTVAPGKMISAIGTGMEVAVTVESVLWSTGLKIMTKLEMAEGWKQYKAALKNPKDRKAVRKAFRSNPTLAKYVIAYGAIEEKNPVAMDVMQKCGLNAEVLDRPSANAQKVVTLLETLCPEDPVLLHAIPVPKQWHPGDAELTSVSVATFFAMAEKEVKLKKGQGRPLVHAISELDDLRSQYDKDHAAFIDAVNASGTEAKDEDERQKVTEQREAATKQLVLTLEAAKTAAKTAASMARGLHPVDTSDKPHEDMENYLTVVSTMADGQFRSYHAEWLGLTADAA